MEAYDLYLRARALENDRGMSGYGQVIDLFEEATAKDPSFAPAYAGLAGAYAAMSGTYPRLDSRDETLSRMRTAAEKAVQLDPLLAEGHEALGMSYARDGQWSAAEASFRRAIALDANRSKAHAHFAMNLLLVLGRIGEAVDQLRVAQKTDPLSAEIQYFLAYGLISAGRFDEAAAYCGKLPADYPAKRECLGRSRLWQGRPGEAIQILTRVGNRGYLGYAYARAGRREDAGKLAAEIRPNPFNEALVFAGLEDRDRTFEALERMTVLGPLRIGRALTLPEFAFIRGDPRTKALRKKVGLGE